MASENKTTTPPQPPKGPSISDTQARDQFIGIALREILRNKIEDYAQPKHAALIGTWAVRIANETMIARANETAALNVVIAKSTVAASALVELPPASPAGEEPPKSITEIIGDKAEPLAELK